ncbi:Lipoprotein-anchoring transpeptidase ErfK/SrfK [Selenomonas ruminantium]|uniref:Lipoprotein-anchoring transpeptidase ErfK/SrfK n=2 Tax=Selenomonas ruminantium TaxID=971 RepID=A0A1H0Q8Q7_SELRU|nr:Lipoprotein-anchoring transpeptidase ErfK/SrfK [Selenomonas ruminantium]
MTSQFDKSIDRSNFMEREEISIMLKNICAGLVGAALLTSGISSYVAAEQADHVPTFADMSVQIKEPTMEEKAAAIAAGQAQVAAQQPKAEPEEKAAQPAPAPAAENKQEKPAPVETEKQSQERKISINLAARSLALFEGNKKIRLYPIGPGKASTPTPVGYYKIESKDYNPTWTDPATGRSIPSGPDCPLGYRWMQIRGNYGIHGTNRPNSIGHYVSNGCIRLHEKDIEALFDLVKIGTPVEITYNRVVVEKLDDNTVVYYIYPDGYGWQNLNVEDVNKWLAGYGVANFVSNEDIEAKINASDGEPTYVAKVYPLYVNGEKMKNKAVEQDGVMYLPAIDLADAAHVNLGWDAAAQKLISTLGTAPGVDKKDVLYCKAADAKTLFKLGGTLDNNNYVMKFVPVETQETVTTKTDEKIDATQKIDHSAEQAEAKNDAKADVKKESKAEVKGESKQAKEEKTK